MFSGRKKSHAITWLFLMLLIACSNLNFVQVNKFNSLLIIKGKTYY